MRITNWIRGEIVNWLRVGEPTLSFKEDGSLTFGYPDPVVIERRKRIVAALKSQWAIGIGCTILGVLLGKLL